MDAITAAGVWIIDLIDVLIKQGTMFAVIVGIIFIFFRSSLLPKPESIGAKIKKKLWDATTQRLKLPKPKQLCLCPYPQSIEDLRDNIYQITYQPIGQVKGVNVAAIETSPQELYKKALQIQKGQDITKIKFPKKDKFWIIFAIEQILPNKFIIFPQTSKTIIYIKPDQIINFNSQDNIIRVRGFGITPQGEFEIINDEDTAISKKQLLSDNINLILSEIVLDKFSLMGDVVTQAMKSDPTWRKDLSIEGIKALVSRNKDEEAL